MDLFLEKVDFIPSKVDFWVIFKGFTDESGPFSSKFSCLGAQFSVFLHKKVGLLSYGGPPPVCFMKSIHIYQKRYQK